QASNVRKWVNNGHRGELRECPLYPRKRISELSRVMSALCQKRTFCAAVETALFDHLVGTADQWWYVEAEYLSCLELIGISRLVGNSSGKSAGVAPFRTLSTKYAARP